VRLPGFIGLLRKIKGDISHRAGGTAVVKQASEDFALTGVITTASLGANQNDFNPTGFATASVVRLTSSIPIDITGFLAPSPAVAAIKVLHNVGANIIALKDENAGSGAANRLALTADVSMSADAVSIIQYDVTTQRWRCVGGGGGGGGAGTGEAYVTIGNTAGLSAERALAVGSGITLTDGGANASVTLAAAAGAILQVLSTTYSANTSLAATPYDDTTPTSGEGTQVLSQAITPSASANKVLCLVVTWGASNDGVITTALFRGTTCLDAKGTTSTYDPNIATGGFPDVHAIVFLDSPATTSSTTYSVRGGGGAARYNGEAGARKYGGTAVCTLTLLEVKG
jgi:hypothetical protein